MSEYIPEKLRLLVIERAGRCCEYCLMHESDLIFSGQIDHIISLKHRGETEANNLAYCCLICNVNKGSDVASYLPGKDKYVPLFHPRKDNWEDHFYYINGKIQAKTDVGNVTVDILQLNRSDRIERRLLLERVGRYPGK